MDEKHDSDHFVFIYQEAKHKANNRMVVFDITEYDIVKSIQINPAKDCFGQMRKDNGDFMQYQICGVSDIEEYRRQKVSDTNQSGVY